MILYAGEPAVVTGVASPVSVPFVVFELGLIRLDEIRRVQKCALFEADVDKRGLHSGQNRFHTPEINVAYASL
jgi:hypothetical protein